MHQCHQQRKKYNLDTVTIKPSYPEEVTTVKQKYPLYPVQIPSKPSPYAEETMTVKPKCPDVTTPKPLCPELTTQNPKCPEVTTETPKCPGVTTETPKCPEVTTETPKCPEVTTETPKCPEVTTAKPKCPEITTQRPKCPEATTQKAPCPSKQSTIGNNFKPISGYGSSEVPPLNLVVQPVLGSTVVYFYKNPSTLPPNQPSYFIPSDPKPLENHTHRPKPPIARLKQLLFPRLYAAFHPDEN